MNLKLLNLVHYLWFDYYFIGLYSKGVYPNVAMQHVNAAIPNWHVLILKM